MIVPIIALSMLVAKPQTKEENDKPQMPPIVVMMNIKDNRKRIKKKKK